MGLGERASRERGLEGALYLAEQSQDLVGAAVDFESWVGGEAVEAVCERPEKVHYVGGERGGHGNCARSKERRSVSYRLEVDSGERSGRSNDYFAILAIVSDRCRCRLRSICV